MQFAKNNLSRKKDKGNYRFGTFQSILKSVGYVRPCEAARPVNTQPYQLGYLAFQFFIGLQKAVKSLNETGFF
jgi:hypothetical protein